MDIEIDFRAFFPCSFRVVISPVPGGSQGLKTLLKSQIGYLVIEGPRTYPVRRPPLCVDRVARYGDFCGLWRLWLLVCTVCVSRSSQLPSSLCQNLPSLALR